MPPNRKPENFAEIAETMTIKEAAKKYRVTQKCAYRWFKDANITPLEVKRNDSQQIEEDQWNWLQRSWR